MDTRIGMKRGFRIMLAAWLLIAVVLCSSCSFGIPIMIVNKSGAEITVRYTLKDKLGRGFVPELVSPSGSRNSITFPKERLAVDFENGVVEARLLPHETIIVDTPSDRIIQRPEEHFNLATLEVAGTFGSVKFEGPEVFESFRPIDNYFFGPKYSRFELEVGTN